MSTATTSAPPSHLLCPITNDLMRDPVIAPDGYSYERSAIQMWLQKSPTSPVTREPLSSSQLIPNRALKDAVNEYVKQNNLGDMNKNDNIALSQPPNRLPLNHEDDSRQRQIEEDAALARRLANDDARNSNNRSNLTALSGVQVSVSNLPFQCNWKLLKDTFAQVAEVVRADVARDENGTSLGFGTVTFRNEEDALLAISQVDGLEMGGRALDVRLVRPLNQGHMEIPNAALPPSSVQVTVLNLHLRCSRKLLKDTFAQVAEVLRADVALDEYGKSRGFGTVVFCHEEDALLAIREFDGVEMGGRPLAVRLDRPQNQDPPRF